MHHHLSAVEGNVRLRLSCCLERGRQDVRFLLLSRIHRVQSRGIHSPSLGAGGQPLEGRGETNRGGSEKTRRRGGRGGNPGVVLGRADGSPRGDANRRNGETCGAEDERGNGGDSAGNGRSMGGERGARTPPGKPHPRRTPETDEGSRRAKESRCGDAYPRPHRRTVQGFRPPTGRATGGQRGRDVLDIQHRSPRPWLAEQSSPPKLDGPRSGGANGISIPPAVVAGNEKDGKYGL
eukprot:scaffold2858_cov659-Pavlova_lutheri.AAC.228